MYRHTTLRCVMDYNTLLLSNINISLGNAGRDTWKYGWLFNKYFTSTLILLYWVWRWQNFENWTIFCDFTGINIYVVSFFSET